MDINIGNTENKMEKEIPNAEIISVEAKPEQEPIKDLVESMEKLELNERCYSLDEGDKKMLPCADFIAGSCEKNQKCMFYHPAEADVAGAIRSPAFPEEFGTKEAVEAAVRDLMATGGGGVGDRLRNRRSRSGPGGYGPRPRADGERAVTFQRNNSRGRSLPMRQRFVAPRHRSALAHRFMFGRDRVQDEGFRPQQRSFAPRQTWTQFEPLEYEDGIVPREYVEPEAVLLDPYSYDNFYNEQFSPYDQYNGYATASPQYEEEEPQTMFSHIDWNKFLAPGRMPPPIVNYTLFGETPVRKNGRNLLEMMVEPPERRNSVSQPKEESMFVSAPAYVNTAAKQEFREKFGRIAAEMKVH